MKKSSGAILSRPMSRFKSGGYISKKRKGKKK